MNATTSTAFDGLLRGHRHRAGLTQEALAERARLSTVRPARPSRIFPRHPFIYPATFVCAAGSV
jgi:hypothetical protein